MGDVGATALAGALKINTGLLMLHLDGSKEEGDDNEEDGDHEDEDEDEDEDGWNDRVGEVGLAALAEALNARPGLRITKEGIEKGILSSREEAEETYTRVELWIKCRSEKANCYGRGKASVDPATDVCSCTCSSPAFTGDKCDKVDKKQAAASHKVDKKQAAASRCAGQKAAVHTKQHTNDEL
jgi:hypothetical protein